MRHRRALTRIGVTSTALILLVGTAVGGALADTPVDEILSFSVRLSDTAELRPPVGETVYGYINTRSSNVTRYTPLGSMAAQLLIDGAPSVQPVTRYGETTIQVGAFGGQQEFKIDVTRPGTYSVLITGSYRYIQDFDVITRPVNVVVPLFVTASGKVPASTGVKKVTGPRTLAFTKQSYRDYKFKVYVRDIDHALDFARVDDVYIPKSQWQRAPRGWVIPYIKTVAPASPYEYKRLPNVYRSKIFINLKDEELEEWQVSRAETVSTSFNVTFRK